MPIADWRVIFFHHIISYEEQRKKDRDSELMLPTGSTAPPNECVGDPTTSHSQANGPFSQLTFKPASGSVSDLLDLNELFAGKMQITNSWIKKLVWFDVDEFYPPDLDFSRFLQENDLSSQPPIHSTIFPSSSQYMPSSYLTSSNQPLPRTIYSGSNDIILIPPTIPTTHSLSNTHQHHLESSEVSEEDKGDKAIGIKREAPSDSRRSFPNKSQKMSELKELSDSQRVERRWEDCSTIRFTSNNAIVGRGIESTPRDRGYERSCC